MSDLRRPVPGRAYAFRRAMTMLAKAHKMPIAKITVPKTKTCGGMPILVALYTHTGNGGWLPLTKFEVTKSSMDRANAISAPARMPGMMIGNVIFWNVVQG